MTELVKGCLVMCLKDEDIDNPNYAQPDVGVVINVKYGDFLQNEEDMVQISTNMALFQGAELKKSDLKFYPSSRVLHIEDFIAKMDTIPQDTFKIKEHIWGIK